MITLRHGITNHTAQERLQAVYIQSLASCCFMSTVVTLIVHRQSLCPTLPGYLVPLLADPAELLLLLETIIGGGGEGGDSADPAAPLADDPADPGVPDDPPLADPDAEEELGIRLVGVVLSDPLEEAAAAAADALPPVGIDNCQSHSITGLPTAVVSPMNTSTARLMCKTYSLARHNICVPTTIWPAALLTSIQAITCEQSCIVAQWYLSRFWTNLLNASAL